MTETPDATKAKPSEWFSDVVRVSIGPSCQVWIMSKEPLLFTPAQARQLAHNLMAAANEAEPQEQDK